MHPPLQPRLEDSTLSPSGRAELPLLNPVKKIGFHQLTSPRFEPGTPHSDGTDLTILCYAPIGRRESLSRNDAIAGPLAPPRFACPGHIGRRGQDSLDFDFIIDSTLLWPVRTGLHCIGSNASIALEATQAYVSGIFSQTTIHSIEGKS